MNETDLTNNEILLLKKQIRKNKSHRNRILKQNVFYIVIGSFLGIFFAYSREIKTVLFLMFIFTLIILIPLGIAFLLAQKENKQLENDLNRGKKIEGNSTVKKINVFNRKITLSNGIKIFESNKEYGVLKKGDNIKFKIGLNSNYIFESYKV